jgi:hypothetical protein
MRRCFLPFGKINMRIIRLLCRGYIEGSTPTPTGNSKPISSPVPTSGFEPNRGSGQTSSSGQPSSYGQPSYSAREVLELVDTRIKQELASRGIRPLDELD